MGLVTQWGGTDETEVFLVSQHGGQTFPASLTVQTDDDSTVEVAIEVAAGGADVSVRPSKFEAGPYPVTVEVHGMSPSMQRNDTSIMVRGDGNIEAMYTVTSLHNPRVFFDGRLEVRFSTGGGPYNDPRGNPDGNGVGWMWALEGEPDFVPADSVPDHIEKPVGRVIRFHNPVAPRPHVPPIGVFARSIEAEVGGITERFVAGDNVLGMPCNLGPATYFASNRPLDPVDQAAGRLPEEQHPDGLQPLAVFEFHIGEAFEGGSRVGPHVPGTTLSNNPRNPDFRPRAQGLVGLHPAERAAYPHPDLQTFSRDRAEQLLPDYEQVKADGQQNTVEFRNLQIRIGHLLPFLTDARRDEILADHGGDGMQVLDRNPGFSWGNKEVYRGLINEGVKTHECESPLIAYFSRFDSFHFLAVFFDFHTDEACAHVYGAVDAMSPPPLLQDTMQ